MADQTHIEGGVKASGSSTVNGNFTVNSGTATVNASTASTPFKVVSNTGVADYDFLTMTNQASGELFKILAQSTDEVFKVSTTGVAIGGDYTLPFAAPAEGQVLTRATGAGAGVLSWEDVPAAPFTADLDDVLNNTTSNATTQSLTVGTFKASSININSSYNLPTSDGTANQVLTTDGSGTVSFADAPTPSIAVDDLSDVNIVGLTTNNFLGWNGSVWTNLTPSVPSLQQITDSGGGTTTGGVVAGSLTSTGNIVAIGNIFSTGTGANTLAGIISSTATGTNSFAGPLSVSSALDSTFSGTVSFNDGITTSATTLDVQKPIVVTNDSHSNKAIEVDYTDTDFTNPIGLNLRGSQSISGVDPILPAIYWEGVNSSALYHPYGGFTCVVEDTTVNSEDSKLEFACSIDGAVSVVLSAGDTVEVNAGTNRYSLPADQGNADEFAVTNGNGTSSWQSLGYVTNPIQTLNSALTQTVTTTATEINLGSVVVDGSDGSTYTVSGTDIRFDDADGTKVYEVTYNVNYQLNTNDGGTTRCFATMQAYINDVAVAQSVGKTYIREYQGSTNGDTDAGRTYTFLVQPANADVMDFRIKGTNNGGTLTDFEVEYLSVLVKRIG